MKGGKICSSVNHKDEMFVMSVGQRKKSESLTGFEPMTSQIPADDSPNSDLSIKAYFGSP